MNIARALKEKNRVAGRLAQLLNTIARDNNRMYPKDRYEDEMLRIRGLETESQNLRKYLIDLKAAIQRATVPICHLLVEQAEFKARIAWVSANIHSEPRENYVSSVVDGKIVQVIETTKPYYSQTEKDTMLKELQTRIEDLQDMIDEHNATTTVVL